MVHSTVRVLTQWIAWLQNLPGPLLQTPGNLYLRHRGTLWSSPARVLILAAQVTLETMRIALLPLVHSVWSLKASPGPIWELDR